MKARLSSRQRGCLQALVDQGEWPAVRGEFGWAGVASRAPWAADTRQLLAALARMGLVVDESSRTVGSRIGADGSALRGVFRASRYVPSAAGRAALEKS